jgi:PAS domain-containing protein
MDRSAWATSSLGVRDTMSRLHLGEAALSWMGRPRRELSQERLRGIWSASPVGMVETDMDQQITDCNPAFAAMVGKAWVEVVGQHGWTFFHPDSPAPDPQAVHDLAAGSRALLGGAVAACW